MDKRISNVQFKVAGVTFEGRQQVIADMMETPSQTIFIEREQNNKFDKNAIKVMWYNQHSGTGQISIRQIGYIPKQYAELLAPMMDSGKIFSAKVANIGNYKDTFYCHITVNEIGG